MEQEKTIKLSSDSTGWFSGKLKAKIKATELTDDEEKIVPYEKNYKVSFEEWGNSLGPIFQEISDNMLNKANQNPHLETATQLGYKNLRDTYGYDYPYNENKSFHCLMQAFSIANGRTTIEDFDMVDMDGNKRENPYQSVLKKFKKAWDEENSIILTQSQLNGLMNIAKAATDYVLGDLPSSKDEDVIAAKSFIKDHIKNNKKFNY
jgi:hypothetical protein